LWASNRDEMLDRPWLPPARHWSDRPEVVAGKDELAGGTWLGVNEVGLIAGILNRRNSLGPMPGKRSRGELVLDALDFADASDAVEMLIELDTNAYRPFNMVLADNTQAFWLRNRGAEVEAFPIPPGVTMVTASDANDPSSKRIRHFLPLWQAAEGPDPDKEDWSEWEELLASREHAPDGDAFDAMNIISNTGFGTSSSSIIALPGVQWAARKPIWRFHTGRSADWQVLSL
jgi:uncharacterized protein with NRDE domain